MGRIDKAVSTGSGSKIFLFDGLDSDSRKTADGADLGQSGYYRRSGTIPVGLAETTEWTGFDIRYLPGGEHAKRMPNPKLHDSASGGPKIGVAAANPRRIPSAKAIAEVVPIVTDRRGDNGRPAHLVIGLPKTCVMFGRHGRLNCQS